MKKFITILLALIMAACIPKQSLMAACQDVNGDNIFLQDVTCTGPLNIKGSNITIQHATILGGSGWYGIKVDNVSSHVNLSDVKISGAKQACIYLAGTDTNAQGWECDNLLAGGGVDSDQNAITVFNSGHKITDGYFHALTCTDNDHCDGVQTWADSQAPVASNVEVAYNIFDMPGRSAAALNKCFQTEGSGDGWNIHNNICKVNLGSIFTNTTGIVLNNNTFIGVASGMTLAQGIKFGTSSATVTNNIFVGFTDGGGAFFPQSYPAPSLKSSFNCYHGDAPRPPDVGDVLADPLLTADYHLASGSPCIGMGAFPVPNAAPTPTLTSSPTASDTPTVVSTITLTATNHPRLTSTPKPTKTSTAAPTGAPGWKCFFDSSTGVTICDIKGVATP